MSSKRLLTVSLLLPLVATSSIAHAGPRITDKSYWPDGWRSSPPPSEAYAVGQRASRAQAVPQVYTDRYRDRAITICTYQGGPKSNIWTCR